MDQEGAGAGSEVRDVGAGPVAHAVGRDWLWLLAVLAVMVTVQSPTLGLGFVGDDFEWWLATRQRMIEPSRFLEPFGGLRLTNPLLLVPDQLLWRTWTPGWHLTTLAIHGLVTALLYGVARRLSLTSPAAAGVATLWATSPFTAFQAREVHPRHDSLLLACWLALGLLWPSRGERWAGRRLAAAIALVVVSALTKESWIVVPGFVAAYELAFRRRGLWTALRTAAVWSLGPVLFVVWYTLWPPVAASYAVGYYEGGLRAAVKIPSTLVAFCGIAGLDPSSSRFGPFEWFATLALVAAVVLALRSRAPALLVGSAFLVLPFLPLAPVPFMPVHYAYAPFAGFLLVAAGGAVALVDGARTRSARIVTRSAVLGLAAGMFAFGLGVMRGELADARRRDEVHRRLVDETEAFLPRMPEEPVLVCVRIERAAVTAWLLEQVEGLPKTYFERGRYPYGLVGWAELWSWVGDPLGMPVWRDVPAGSVGDLPFVVIGHVADRFVTLPSEQPTAADAARMWSDQGHQVRMIRPYSQEGLEGRRVSPEVVRSRPHAHKPSSPGWAGAGGPPRLETRAVGPP
jgi:hypothetical protein